MQAEMLLHLPPSLHASNNAEIFYKQNNERDLSSNVNVNIDKQKMTNIYSYKNKVERSDLPLWWSVISLRKKLPVCLRLPPTQVTVGAGGATIQQ